MQPVNPYAAGTTTNEGDHKRRPPRWLAVLVSVMTVTLAGGGTFLLRRSPRDWICPALSVMALAGYALAAALAPALVVPAMMTILLVWVVGVLVTVRARASGFVGWPKTLALTAAVLVASYALALTSRVVAVQPFQIPAASMAPTLLPGDHIVVSKAARVPARGDVVVFRYPHNPKVDYVKRVIGLPGETLSIRQNQVLVDGKPLAVRRLDEPCATGGRSCQIWEERAGQHTYRLMHDESRPPSDFAPVAIPPGQYFLLGDNRENSNDSRVWGPIPGTSIEGRAAVIWRSKAPAGERWGRVGKPVD